MEMRTKYLIGILTICFVVAAYAYYIPQKNINVKIDQIVNPVEKPPVQKVYGALDEAPENLKNDDPDSCVMGYNCPGD